MSDLSPSRPIVKRPSCLWAWLRGAGFCFQMTLALAFVFFGAYAYVVRTRLQATMAELDRTDPGWRLPDIEAARAVVPDAENSALRVIEANKLLPEPPAQWLEDDFDAELYSLPPERRMTPAQYAHLHQRLDKVKPALDELEGLSALQSGRFPITYAQNPWHTLLPEQQKSRRVIHLLMRDCMAHAEAGETHQAINSCLGVFNAARSIGDEPFAITQLIRLAGVMIACRSAERILAQTQPDLDDLKRLQELVEKEDTTPYESITRRGERALENANFEALESGFSTWSKWGDSPRDWSDHVINFAFQDYVRSLHPQVFVYSARMQAACKLPPKLRQPAMQQIELEMCQDGPTPVTMWFLNYPKMEPAFSRCHAILRCQATALAAERYRRLHGHWPQLLDQLAPDFIAAVPTDSFTDDPLLYRRLPDGVVIYSVGLDGEDNGGNVEMGKPNDPGTDIGIRLWDVTKRRQPPKADEPAKQP
jgi:hypothetical protein